MIRNLSIAAMLMLAACQQQEAPPSNEAAATQPAAPAPAAIPSLEGEWRVTMIGGDPNAAGPGMTASFGDGMARLSTGCLRRAWTYSQKRNSLTFTSSPGGSSNCGGSPGPGEDAAYAAVDGANIGLFEDDGKQVTLSGTGGTITLERR